MFMHNRNKGRLGIFVEKGTNEQFCSNKESNNNPVKYN